MQDVTMKGVHWDRSKNFPKAGYNPEVWELKAPSAIQAGLGNCRKHVSVQFLTFFSCRNLEIKLGGAEQVYEIRKVRRYNGKLNSHNPPSEHTSWFRLTNSSTETFHHEAHANAPLKHVV